MTKLTIPGWVGRWDLTRWYTRVLYPTVTRVISSAAYGFTLGGGMSRKGILAWGCGSKVSAFRLVPVSPSSRRER